MNISLYNIYQNKTTLLKAIGILLIVTHNFIHVTSKIGNNELAFNPEITYRFFNSFIDTPLRFFSSIASYLGHYGVQIFIFCSAYGLAKKYNNKVLSTYFRYFLNKVSELYILIMIGLIWYAIFYMDKITLESFLEVSLFFFKMTSNFSYETVHLYVGPWWYFSLAIQLYIIFPFLFYVFIKYKEKGGIILLVLSYILIYSIFPYAEKHDFPIYANAIGHLPEFVFGIMVARYDRFRINPKILLVAVIVFILSCFSEWFYPFSFLSMLVILLTGSYYLIQYIEKRKITEKVFSFIGKISMFMFILNVFPRKYLLTSFYERGWGTVELLGYTILQLFLVIALSALTYFIYNFIKERVILKSLDYLRR